ncbi:AMP-binding protein [Salinisphaera sp. T31B1]|uniref:AMP-binding protein n=1 Tax=Salinisphaera sp. T31B1 TaxID=727963 RepID=UPI00333E99D9
MTPTPTLSHALRHQAASRPDAPALCFYPARQDTHEPWITFAQADARVSRVAATLRQHGVTRGDRVAVRLGKSADGILLFLGVLRAGAIYVPVNPGFTAREAGILLEDSTPSLLIDNDAQALNLADDTPYKIIAYGDGSADDLLNTAEPAADIQDEPQPDDYAAMLFTSGTTGRPKGAPLTHANLMSNLDALAEAWQISPDDRVLHVLPVFHAHGLFVAAAMPLSTGASLMITETFDAAQACRLLPEATVFMAVPAIYTRLLAQPGFDRRACRNLRLATSGSAPLSPEMFAALQQAMGVTVVERYGLTETSILTSNPIDGSARVGSVGKPLSIVDLRITDAAGVPVTDGEVGSLQARSPATIGQYWNRPELTDDWTQDGFFDTGDMGRFDADGYVWLVGRKKELIISGGYNVYPREVENVLETVPGVEEAVVLGVPHPDFGEGVLAAIRCQPDERVTEAMINERAMSDLAAYKRPKAVVFVDEFPRNAMGKVMKKTLQATYAELFAQPR